MRVVPIETKVTLLGMGQRARANQALSFEKLLAAKSRG